MTNIITIAKKQSKEYLLYVFRAIKYFFVRKKNKKRLDKQKDGTVFSPIVYCPIRQDRTMIKDIIEGKINPKDDKKWAGSGAFSLDEYEKRTWQICGITSFQMYLETKRIPYVGGNISLVYESLIYGTYKYDPRYNSPTDFHISSLYHKAFLTYIKNRYNVLGTSKEGVDLIEAVKQFASGKFVLLSLNQNIRDTTINPKYCDYTGRHIVVLTGYTINNTEIESIYIHNSSGFIENNSQENFAIPLALAQQVFTRKILILS